ncbi:2-amino-4-hydroxy-6-hydroxymethyldihydropteridine diphosphokinase [Rhodovibrio salinarum]|uniref:2-amino-4-hydroxy-6-hydroxymethyldihydropteridine pyrophosphokinase n=1 Tax=Rhodovibrio salinarum TaxID=1087 RepID=A0A934QJF7_9PROT|nr:2-amino-4-hydroxy-6-hydroxymethyldihydropteridine diphosphokinase [Rhodovibrio salinarum]
MSYIALGANLASERFGPPKATLTAALALMAERGLPVAARSSWYESAPVPMSDQPWFINAVVRLDATPDPGPLLETLHALEAELGRVRSIANAPRAVDLDLIDAGGRVSASDDWPVLPHPRLHARAFVLMPLKEIAPDWRHPATGTHIDTLLAALPADQSCRKIPDTQAES